MKVFRFMGYDELEKYVKGEKLVNNKHHPGRTNSIGFCFLDAEEFDWKKAYDFLHGVVDDDFLVIFETDKHLIKTWGEYAKQMPDEIASGPTINWLNWLWGHYFDTTRINEYCTTKYSRNDMKLVSIYKSIRYSDTDDLVVDWVRIDKI